MKSLSAWRGRLIGTPSNPAADEGLLYFKSDGKLYKKIGSIETVVEGNTSLLAILGERSRTIDFSLGANVWTPIPFDSQQTGDGITWDNTNFRFNIPVSGRYAVDANVMFRPSSNNLIGAEIAVNGVRRVVAHDLGSTNLKSFSPSKTLKLVAGDFVSIRAYGATAATVYGDTVQGTSVSIAIVN